MFTGEDMLAQRRTRSYSTILSCLHCQLYLDRQDGSPETTVMPLRPHLPQMISLRIISLDAAANVAFVPLSDTH